MGILRDKSAFMKVMKVNSSFLHKISARCVRHVNGYKDTIIKLGRYIHHNPEIGFKEEKAVTSIIEFLNSLGFKTEINYCQLKTAFKSVIKNGNKGKSVAVLAEYDALPGLGHGCGHNLISVAAVTSAVIMTKTRELWEGEFCVIGTPAEELYAGKGIMAERGAFSGIDACFMAHPSSSSMMTVPSNALETIIITFKGKAAHAAVNPEDGINALDAAVLFYNSINSLRQHMREDARLHAIITEGGKAVNVIPDTAEVKVVVRSNDEKYLSELKRRVCNAAKSAGKAIGADVLLKEEKPSYRAFKINLWLDNILRETFKLIGIELGMPHAKESRGSLDMGNVSRIIPSAHPFFSIVPKGKKHIPLHTNRFMKQADTNYAYEQAIKAGIAMALAAISLLARRKR